MTTVFTINPIKLNIISKKNTIKKTIVFIGIVPKEVKNELQKIESSQKFNVNNRILKKFYGNQWFIKLGMKKSLIGGDDFSFDELETNEIADNVDVDEAEIADIDKIENNPNGAEIADIDKIENNPNGAEIAYIDKIENIISLDDMDDTILEVKSDQKLVSQITETDAGLKIKFIFSDPFISIYPEDKVLEFKKKIYLSINIPIYRQHIWYIYQGRTYPLSYSVFDNNQLLYINVQNMLNNLNDQKDSQLIEGIPVDNKYYQKKSFLKITTLDTFSIMNEYYHKYGVTEYNLLDLDDFIKPVRSSLINVISERYQLELIYYSFIMIYWPMFSLTAFSDYIKSETNIAKFYPDLYTDIN
jgi:hypothetical protein